jgi:hypothetical protein
MTPEDTADAAKAVPSPAPDLAAWHEIPLARWYADVAEANPHRCQHDGPCGDRFLCDREEHRAGGYPTVELLASGRLLFHCEGLNLTPAEPSYDARRANLAPREVA